MRTSVRQSVRVITACMPVMLSMPCAPAGAAPADSVIRGGRYVISIGRIHDAGEMYLARTKPVLRAGSTIGFELSGCEQDHSVAVVEVDLRGTYIHPDGRFRLRKVVKFYGGGVAEIWHVQGLFSSSTFAHGTVWGHTAPARCRVRSKRPLHFKASYDGQGYYH
jgi:hypothetical protein